MSFLIYFSFYDIICLFMGVFMKKVNKFTLEELKSIRHFASSYSDLELLLKDLDFMIQSREMDEMQNLNVRFNMDYFIQYQIFDPAEWVVIQKNHIMNLQELIDCNLDDLIGITPNVKKGLDWVRHFYDMSSVSKSHSRKKIKKL